MIDLPPQPDCCQLCGRPMAALTRHHLIPRTRHRNRRNKKRFGREEVKSRILWVCRPCHSHIHRTFTEKELERRFNTGEALRSHPEIQRFVRWISGKPEGFKPKSPAPGRR